MQRDFHSISGDETMQDSYLLATYRVEDLELKKNSITFQDVEDTSFFDMPLSQKHLYTTKDDNYIKLFERV